MCVCVCDFYDVHWSLYVLRKRKSERENVRTSSTHTIEELRVSRRIEFSEIHAGLVSGGFLYFVFGGDDESAEDRDKTTEQIDDSVIINV